MSSLPRQHSFHVEHQTSAYWLGFPSCRARCPSGPRTRPAPFAIPEHRATARPVGASRPLSEPDRQCGMCSTWNMRTHHTGERASSNDPSPRPLQAARKPRPADPRSRGYPRCSRCHQIKNSVPFYVPRGTGALGYSGRAPTRSFHVEHLSAIASEITGIEPIQRSIASFRQRG